MGAVWRRLAGAWGVALLAAAGAAFLVLRPHDDRMSGLDSMCYGAMSEAVAGGRAWVGEDGVWAQVPRAARRGLLYGRGNRVTRDWVWQWSPEDGRDAMTRPYFPPGPAWLGSWMARAGVGAERTVPLLGAIWWCCLLAAGWKRGGWAGVVASAALAVATPWPAWFLRGWHAEAAGAAVVGAAWLSASMGGGAGGGWWRRGAFPAAVGFLLGGSLCLHPTMLLLAGPAALVLGLHVAWSGNGRGAGWLWGGAAAGAGLLWWTTRAVAHPYGDWTRWAWWRQMFVHGTIAEHGVMAAGLAGLVLLGVAAGLAAWHPACRRLARAAAGKIPGWAWAAAGVVPAVLGVRVGPGLAVLGAAAVWALWAGKGRDRAMALAVLWSGVLFAAIQAAEKPTGIWGLRRMLPSVLMAATVAGPAVGEAMRRWKGRRWAWGAVALAAVCAWGPMRGGWVWAARNGSGGGAAVAALRAWMDAKEADAAARGADKPWFVFGEFRTAQGAMASGEHLAVALGGMGRADPAVVLAWVRRLAASGREVWWVSGLGAVPLEEGGVLEGEETIWDGVMRTVNSKRFLPAEWRTRELHWKGWRWRAPGEGDGAVGQDVALEGAVLGIRGPWGQERKGGRWTREGSGVVGPTGTRGGKVEVTVEGSWPGGLGAADVQTLLVEGPWGGAAGELSFSPEEGWAVRSVVLEVPEDAEWAGGTGIYRFRAAHPWNPGANGLRGYEGDLGILARRVKIRAVP